MALEPYRNEVAYGRADARDVSLPAVNGVIDLRGAVDDIADVFKPGIEKKVKEDAERDALQAVGKDENGNYVRAKTPKGHGRIYQETFEKAAGNLHVLEITSRTEEAFNAMMRDDKLRNDPEAMAVSMKAYREGLLETVGPDIALKVDEVIRREASQRLLTQSNRVETEERQRVARGNWNLFQGMKTKYTQLLPRQDEPGVKQELELLQKSMNETSGVLMKIGEANPEYFAGEWMQVEAALVDYNSTRAAEDWQAANSGNLAKLPDVQLKALFEVLSGGDVAPDMQFELPGIGKVTVANMRKLDPRVMNGLRSNVGRWISEREQQANQRAAEQARIDSEEEDRRELVSLANNVNFMPATKKQRDAADEAFLVETGGKSEDGQSVDVPRFLEMMEVTPKDEAIPPGQRTAISYFERYRHLPVPALTWLTESYTNGKWQAATTFVTNLRDARDPRTSARVGDAIYNELPRAVRQSFMAATTMMRLGMEAKIPLTMAKMATGDVVPRNLAENKMAAAKIVWKKASDDELGRQFPGIDVANLPKQLGDEFRFIADTLAFSDVPADQIMRESARFIKSGWSVDPRLIGNIGPKKFTDEGFTNRELDRAIRKLFPVKAVYSFEKGTMALEPVRRSDARAGFGIWRVVSRDPRTGARGGGFREIDMDKIVDFTKAARRQLRDPQLLAAREAAARAQQARGPIPRADIERMKRQAPGR